MTMMVETDVRSRAIFSLVRQRRRLFSAGTAAAASE